jgi:hypothetical protein
LIGFPSAKPRTGASRLLTIEFDRLEAVSVRRLASVSRCSARAGRSADCPTLPFAIQSFGFLAGIKIPFLEPVWIDSAFELAMRVLCQLFCEQLPQVISDQLADILAPAQAQRRSSPVDELRG